MCEPDFTKFNPFTLHIMKNQFVPDHITIDLKELGFDEPCILGLSTLGVSRHKFTSPMTDDDYIRWDKYDTALPIPLWQQVEQWFREKHGILISVDAVKYRRGNLEWGYFISIRNSGGYIITGCEHKGIEDPYKIPYYHSYEEAREAAVLEAIELLKEKNYEQI